jgi:hypothetical protein
MSSSHEKRPAFVLMPNHEHLFVETPEANLSAGMQLLNSSYAGYFNRRHNRVGHLFQGRYKGHLIEEDGYFLQVSRYFHLNPVRARLVARPEDWQWSSFHGYQQARRSLEWVTYARVLGAFGADLSQARRAYTRFVREGLHDPPPSPWASAQLGIDTRNGACGRRSNDAGRAMAAYLARARFGYAATDIARELGYRGASSVSHAIRRIERRSDAFKEVPAAVESQLK